MTDFVKPAAQCGALKIEILLEPTQAFQLIVRRSSVCESERERRQTQSLRFLNGHFCSLLFLARSEHTHAQPGRCAGHTRTHTHTHTMPSKGKSIFPSKSAVAFTLARMQRLHWQDQRRRTWSQRSLSVALLLSVY